METENLKHEKYLRACNLLNDGVDFFFVAELKGITMIEAVELMTEDYNYNRYFELKKSKKTKK